MLIHRAWKIRLFLIIAISSNLYVSESYAASGSAAYQSMIAEMPWNVKKVSDDISKKLIDDSSKLLPQQRTHEKLSGNSKSNLDTKHTSEKYKKDLSDDRSAVERYQKKQEANKARNGRAIPSLESIAADTIAKKFVHTFQQKKTYEDKIRYCNEAPELRQLPESLRPIIWRHIAPRLELHKSFPLISSNHNGLLGHMDVVRTIAWSPDGTKIATASKNGAVRVWHAHTKKMLLTLGVFESICSVSWSSDGRMIVTVERNGTIKTWNADTGQCLTEKQTPHEFYRELVAWNPGRDRMAIVHEIGKYIHVKILSAEHDQSLSEKTLLTIRNDYIRSFAWSPDGSNIAIVFGGMPIEIRETLNGTLLHRLDKPGVTSIAWSPNGNKLAVGCYDGSVSICNSNGRWLPVQFKQDQPVNTIAWSPDGSKIAIGSMTSGVNIIDANSGSSMNILERCPAWMYTIEWSPNGSEIAGILQESSPRIWDMSFFNDQQYIDFCNGLLTEEQCRFLMWLEQQRTNSYNLKLSPEIQTKLATFHPVIQESIKRHYFTSYKALQKNDKDVRPITTKTTKAIVAGIWGLTAIAVGCISCWGASQIKNAHAKRISSGFILGGLVGLSYGMYKWIKG